MMVFEKEPIGLRINSPNPIDREISDSLVVCSRILRVISVYSDSASIICENIPGLKNMVQALLIKKPKLVAHSIYGRIYNNNNMDISIYLIQALRLLVKNKQLKKILILKVPDTIQTICKRVSQADTSDEFN
jgi:hypothetical protein